MKVLLLLLALARAAPDDAPETPTAPPEAPVEIPPEAAVATFAEDLDAAKRLYFEGGHEEALARLRTLRIRLESGEVVPVDQYVDTFVYQGELEFQLGDRTASWATFEALLQVVPSAGISPLEHPIDVVRWFELVREKVEQDRAALPDPPVIRPPPPPPVWAYAPIGIPQFLMDRPSRGAAYLTLQTGFAAVSVWSYVRLSRINGTNHPPQWEEDEVARRVNVERWAIQWPATFGFYATWAVSVVDARRAWRLDHTPISVGVEPRPGGAVLVMRGRL